MNERVIYHDLIVAWFIIAGLVFIALFFFSAPYGTSVMAGDRPSTTHWAG